MSEFISLNSKIHRQKYNYNEVSLFVCFLFCLFVCYSLLTVIGISRLPRWSQGS